MPEVLGKKPQTKNEGSEQQGSSQNPQSETSIKSRVFISPQTSLSENPIARITLARESKDIKTLSEFLCSSNIEERKKAEDSLLLLLDSANEEEFVSTIRALLENGNFETGVRLILRLNMKEEDHSKTLLDLIRESAKAFRTLASAMLEILNNESNPRILSFVGRIIMNSEEMQDIIEKQKLPLGLVHQVPVYTFHNIISEDEAAEYIADQMLRHGEQFNGISKYLSERGIHFTGNADDDFTMRMREFLIDPEFRKFLPNSYVLESEFEAFLRSRIESGCIFMTIKELREYEKEELDAGNGVCITFDDGYVSQLKAKEIMEKLEKELNVSITATFFVVGSSVFASSNGETKDGEHPKMTFQDLKTLQEDGYEIGCHTWDFHGNMRSSPYVIEMKKNEREKAIVEDLLKFYIAGIANGLDPLKVLTFSYPWGRASRDTQEILVGDGKAPSPLFMAISDFANNPEELRSFITGNFIQGTINSFESIQAGFERIRDGGSEAFQFFCMGYTEKPRAWFDQMAHEEPFLPYIRCEAYSFMNLEGAFQKLVEKQALYAKR